MSDDRQSFDLSRFLEENIELFTLLSVFGAISIYLAQFSADVNSNWKHVGQVSGIIIFFLVALEIRRDLKSRLDSSLFDFLIKPRKESYRLLLFVVPFYLLVLSIVSIVIHYPAAGTLVGQAILLFIGMSSVLWVVISGESLLGFEDLGEIGRDRRGVSFGKFLLTISISGIFFSSLALFHIGTKYGYGFNALRNLRPGPGIVPFLVSFLGGILLGSILFLCLSCLLFVIHQIVQHIDQMEDKEQFIRFSQALFGGETSTQSELSDFEED